MVYLGRTAHRRGPHPEDDEEALQRTYRVQNRVPTYWGTGRQEAKMESAARLRPQGGNGLWKLQNTPILAARSKSGSVRTWSNSAAGCGGQRVEALLQSAVKLSGLMP